MTRRRRKGGGGWMTDGLDESLTTFVLLMKIAETA